MHKNIVLAFCLLAFVGCGNLSEVPSLDEATAGETEQSSSEDEGWPSETTHPDPD